MSAKPSCLQKTIGMDFVGGGVLGGGTWGEAAGRKREVAHSGLGTVSLGNKDRGQ